MADLTVRVTCYRKDANTDPTGDGSVALSFQADPADPGNTALLGNLFASTAVTPEAAEAFEVGTAYTLTIAQEDA